MNKALNKIKKWRNSFLTMGQLKDFLSQMDHKCYDVEEGRFDEIKKYNIPISNRIKKKDISAFLSKGGEKKFAQIITDPKTLREIRIQNREDKIKKILN